MGINESKPPKEYSDYLKQYEKVRTIKDKRIHNGEIY